jgi:hypothetical protein
MTSILAGLLASIGLALVLTALVLPNRQTPQVITATTNGLAKLSEAALGYQV